VRATGIDRSTLADLVARMIGKDLVARERSAADARANTVSLTDTGRAALTATSPRVAAADARILKLLPARKRDTFLSVLHDMGRAAETAPAEAVEAAPKAKKKKKTKDRAAKAAKPIKAPKTEKAAKTASPAKASKAAAADGGKKKKAKKASAMAESAV